ncbi:hypothetical protein JCM10908_005854 [Rhodotorula pacifica]|uniref:NmrA/HSCARG family protein n=1 Tax=Rhodotorula pacifica TaxID=1495444 RepID=UPI003175672F
MSGPILVVGATGKQGSAVIRALKSMPEAPAVRALTRSLDSPKAQELKTQGIEVVKGSLSDVESLKRALVGARAAFLVTLRGVDGGLDEDQQGYNFIEAAKAVQLPYLVFTSVSDATVDCGVPHFETKAKVEVALKDSGLRHAVVAPAGFYDNFPRQSSVASFFGMGLFDAGLHGAPLKMVATDDIGQVAAQMLVDPATYAGRHINLAGDELTMAQVRDTYSRVEKRSVWKAWLPSFVLYALPYDLRSMFAFFAENGLTADVAALKKEFPTMRTFEQYLREGSKAE